MQQSKRASGTRPIDGVAGMYTDGVANSSSVKTAANPSSSSFKNSLQRYAFAGADVGANVSTSAPLSPTPRRSLRNAHAVPGTAATSLRVYAPEAPKSLMPAADLHPGRPQGLAPASPAQPTISTPAEPGKRPRKRGPSEAFGSPAIAALPSPAEKSPARKSSKYAAPAKYAHLPPLTDILARDLVCVFIGTNPGIRTSTAGHAYAHPSNSFWKLLHSSGCTTRRLRPEEDGTLPHDWGMGNTNIVERPTKDAAELSKAEMCEGALVLETKMAKWRPEAVCIVGKGIWEAIWRSRYGRNPTKAEFRWGWQDEKENMGRVVSEGDEEGANVEKDQKPWNGARVYVTSSTSGLSASLKPSEKEAIWRPFGEWVQQRRAERSVAGHSPPLFHAEVKREEGDVETTTKEVVDVDTKPL